MEYRKFFVEELREGREQELAAGEGDAGEYKVLCWKAAGGARVDANRRKQKLAADEGDFFREGLLSDRTGVEVGGRSPPLLTKEMYRRDLRNRRSLHHVCN